MTTDPEPATVAGPAGPELAELAGMLREVTGETEQWADRIGPATLVDGELQLESIELTALAMLVQQRYGIGAELTGYLAGLDLDQLIALTVGDLLAHLRRAAACPEPVR